MQHSGQLVGKHIDDHQRLRTRILELVHHFFFGVERVGVDQHTTGLEHAKRHHRVGQTVGQLNRNPVTRLQAQHAAQVAGKCVRQRVNLGKSQTTVHAVGYHTGECGLLGRRLGIAAAGLVHQRGQAGVGGWVELGRDARLVVGGTPRRIVWGGDV